MLVFPQLSSGANVQYPLARTDSSRTVVNVLQDGSMVKFEDVSASRTRWTLRLESLDQAERLAIEQLFLATEGELNAFGKWGEGLPKQVEHASGLGEQGMQLRKDRMSAVGTVEHLVLAVISEDEASSCQCGELALNSPYASLDVPCELSYKECSFWFVIESRKDSSPRLTEEQITKRTRVRSHYENNCTHNENARNKVVPNFHIGN